ncbi:MAG: insulinase family protein [Candidatus Omnitrophica bacterium]|nr:insulinase family protein [Candidatus Omnitrophota bacterium]
MYSLTKEAKKYIHIYMNKLKTTIKIITILSLLSLIVLPLLQESRADTTNLTSELPTNKTEKIILDNGLTILLKELPSSEIACIVALIKSGSAREARFLGSGIAHLCEHMLFKDDPENPKSEIAKQVSLLGGTINGSTSYDWTSYQISLPKENLLAALELFYQFLMKAQFQQEDLEKEKQVVLKEINLGKDNPHKLLWNLLLQTTFNNHPYRYPIIGYENLLKRLTLANLRKFYKQTYVPQNLIISISGSFDRKQIKNRIQDLFGKDEMGPIQSKYDIVEPQQNTMRQVLKDLKATTFGYAALGFRSVSIHEKDLYALDLLASILGEGTSSRLNQNLKEEKKLVYSIDALNYTPKDPGLFVITFTSEPENQDKAYDEILKEIENIKEFEVNKEELIRAKQSIKSGLLFRLAACENLATSSAHNEATLGDPDFDEEYIRKIENITSLEVRNAALKYLNSSSLSFLRVIPQDKEKCEKTIPKSATEKQEIKRIELDGGLRILLLEDDRLPIVNIRVAFLGGLLAENNKNNGISDLTSKLLLKGTKTKSAFEISRLMESWGGNISSFSGNNSFGISIEVLKENTESTLKLVSEIILSPAFDAVEIDKEKNLNLAQLKRQREDIFTRGSLLLKKEIYQDHPYSMNALGTQDSIASLNRKSILDFYKQHIRKPNIVISVFGDIDNQRTLKLIKNLFANLDNKVVSFTAKERIMPLKNSITNFDILEKEQSLFLIGFPTCSLKNPDRYVLDIISEVLSGLDGRLFRNIREELGIAYALSADNANLLEAGHFLFYVATTSENLKKAQEKIWQEINSLKKKGIDEEELERAKRSLTGKMKISLEANAALSWHAILDELYGLGFLNYKDYESRLNSITTKKVKNILNKYFNDNFVEIFITPTSFFPEPGPAKGLSFRH